MATCYCTGACLNGRGCYRGYINNPWKPIPPYPKPYPWPRPVPNYPPAIAPKVKRITYNEDGSIKEIEYYE